MKLTTKATLLVLGNAVLTIGIGLGARNLVLNPELNAVEQIQDSKNITRLENGIEQVQQRLTQRVDRIAATSLLVSDPVPWHSLAVAQGTCNELDYFIASSSDGGLAVVQPGEYGSAPDTQLSPTAVNQILLHALKKLTDNGGTISGIVGTGDGPVVYAAGAASIPGSQWLSRLILVQRLDQALLTSLAQSLELDVTPISPDVFLHKVGTDGVKLGQRTADNLLYWVINDDDGKPVLQLQFETDQRGYDTRILSPTLLLSLAASIALWLIALIWYHRHTVRPLERLSAELRSIRQQNAFGKRLQYRHRDEVSSLVHECNALLQHVETRTRELHSHSYTDPLTGIGNRRYFEEKLSDFWHLCQREQIPLSVIVLDIDYFKQYNDTYGHDGGDRVLRQFADLLRKSISLGGNIVARTGGEEFSAILFDTPNEDAVKQAERIVTAMRYKRVPHASSAIAGHLTVSAGVASLVPNELLNPEDLVNQADRALYAAKRLGRNRVETFRKPSALETAASRNS